MMETTRSEIAARWALALALAWVTALAPATAAEMEAPGTGASDVVRHTTERLFGAMGERRGELDADPLVAIALVEEIVVPALDLEAASRWVLGRHWRGASAEQRVRFIDAFKGLLVRTYAAAVTGHAEQVVSYLPERSGASENDVTVRTEVPRPGGAAVQIDYRVHRRDGAWKVYDVIVEGVSLVATYRGSFSEEVRRRGLDGLIEDLAAKNRGAGGATG